VGADALAVSNKQADGAAALSGGRKCHDLALSTAVLPYLPLSGISISSLFGGTATRGGAFGMASGSMALCAA